MTLCLDIHTHHPVPQPLGVVAIDPHDFNPDPQQLYSVGYHPWETTGNFTLQDWNILEEAAARPEVVAIGECGVDKLKGGPLYRQLIVFKHHVDLSEKLEKPLVIHDVKAHDIIVGLKKDYSPRQKWLVHGFRGKPTVAKMLTDAGIFLSYGEKFNEESLRQTPRDMILAETDESTLDITQIINGLSAALGEDIQELIKTNTQNFLWGNLFGENKEDITK